MPVAKITPSPENYVPSELMQTRTILPGNQYLFVTPITSPHSTLTPEQQNRWAHKAAILTQHIRQHLGLGPHEQLEHLYPQNYHEYDRNNKEIPGTGAMVFFPVVRGADGVLHRPAEEDAIWVDDTHQPDFLTDEDRAFAGRIALETDELDGGWVVNHLTDAESSRNRTPRARMLARELAQVTQLPPLEMPAATGEQSAA